MFISKQTQRRVNPLAPYTAEDGVTYPRLPEDLYEEIAEPAAPADFSDELYYRTEQDDAPYVIYTRKSDEQIRQAQLAKMVPVSPRQIRMALTRANLRTQVEAAVAAGDQDLKDWYEFSTAFERVNPQVTAMATALSVSEEQLDNLWKLAATL
jgi:hypothetical protein